MKTTRDPIVDALLDQLADAKCAVRDGLYTYAIQCIETAEILAKGIEDGPTPTNGRHKFVARILGTK